MTSAPVKADLGRLQQLVAAGNPDALRAAQAYERMRRHRRGSKAYSFERRTVERLAVKAAEAWIRGES